MFNMTFVIYVFFIFVSFIFVILTFLKMKKTIRTSHTVKSKETNKLSDISSYLNDYIELYTEINGDYLVSPISKTKCVKYRVEVYYSLDHSKMLKTKGLDLLTSAIAEEKQVDSVYIIEDDALISINLDQQKKVYMNSLEWHLFNINEKSIVEDYLNLDKNQHFIESLGLGRNTIFGVRESIIPHGKKVYLLGKVMHWPLPDGIYVETKKSYKYLPYTLKGYLDSVSEKNFLVFLRNRYLFQLYTILAFSIVPLIVIFSFFMD